MNHESHVWRWRQHRFRADWRCRCRFFLTRLTVLLVLISAVIAAGVHALGFA